MRSNLIEDTIIATERLLETATNPAVLVSFGKDSMVLYHLLRHLRLPVVYCASAYSTEDQIRHAANVATDWSLNVTVLQPVGVRLLTNGEHLAMRTFYLIGDQKALGWTQRVADEPVECGLQVMLAAPFTPTIPSFDVLISGQKNGDPDFLGGRHTVPEKIGEAPAFIHPLRDWTDADVMAYARTFKLNLDASRYDLTTGAEITGTTSSNDRLPLCMACVDKRHGHKEVDCPKYGRIPFNHQIASQAYAHN